MSADRRREKPAPTRPLAPRLAAAAPPSRSSPTPRLAPQLAAPLASPNTPPLRPKPAFGPVGAQSKYAATSNVTPRSAQRKLRSESTPNNSTPTSVRIEGSVQPRSNPPLSPASRLQKAGVVNPTISERSASDMNRLAINANNGPKSRPFSPPGSHVLTPGQRLESSLSEHSLQSPSFFYANDRPTDGPAPKPAPPPKATFLYANGIAEEPERPVSEPANGTPKSTMMTPLTAGISASANPTARPLSEATSPINQPIASPFFRSPSPTKDNFHLTYRKGVSQVLRPPVSNAPLDLHSSRTSQDMSRGPRRSSIDGRSEGTTHSRGASQSSVGSNHQPIPLRADANAARTVDNAKRPMMSPVLMPASSSSMFSSEANLLATPSSPTHSFESSQRPLSGSQADLAADMAADARRERKVLDLEITNSSLLAINRSLEREVRKQKSELRRMRRMTRNSNRQSWLSHGSGSAQLGALDEDSEDSDAADASDAESEDGSESGSLDDEAMSPEALAQNDARHQRGDEKRLLLDLTKHKELLVDSQKLNQSIKRCLGVTEQLIADGRRALEYQVRVSEIQLGGRVLSPEEVSERAMIGGLAEESYFPEFSNIEDAGDTGEVIDLAEVDSGDSLEHARLSQPEVPLRLATAEVG